MLRRTGMSEHHPRLVSSHLPAVQRVPVGQTSHRHPIYPVYEEKSVAGKRPDRYYFGSIVSSAQMCMHSVDSISPGQLPKTKNKQNILSAQYALSFVLAEKFFYGRPPNRCKKVPVPPAKLDGLTNDYLRHCECNLNNWSTRVHSKC